MKKFIFIPFLPFLILFTGCGESNTKSKQPINAEMDTLQKKKEIENKGEEAETSGKLVLNNGVKWQANAATTEGIQKMQTMVNDYLNKNDTDNNKLSENLEKELTIILQKCTMTGTAHEQLHSFLLPLKENMKKLKDSKQTEKVKEIQTYLNTYNNYFD